MGTIRAAVMTAPRSPIEVWDLPEPELEDGSVLLETLASEVCGTDVHLRHGRLSGVPYPIIPGHVSVGRVAESRGVSHDALGSPLARGDLVTFLDVHGTCHRCHHCLVAGQPNRCPSRQVYGITHTVDEGLLGGWAEAIHLKPDVHIVKLPAALREGVSDSAVDAVIGGGCGLFTGYATVERSGMAMGDVVVVQGSGPVGLSALAFAGLRGAGRLIMIGAPAARLDLARVLGADEVLDLGETTPEERREAVLDGTGGRGADVVLEASGNPAAIPEGLDFLRDGGCYVIAGHYTDAGSVEINPHTQINRKHAQVLGQWGTDFRHVSGALTMLARHRDRLPFERVIGGRYGLDEAERALDDVEALRVTKAIIVPRSVASDRA